MICSMVIPRTFMLALYKRYVLSDQFLVHWQGTQLGKIDNDLFPLIALTVSPALGKLSSRDEGSR